MKKIIITAITVLIILSGCTKKEESYKEETVNGVKHCINTDTPNDPAAKLDLKKLFTISSEAQTDSNAFLKRPVSLTVDKNDNIFVLDVFSMSVKKFDGKGNFVKSIGRQGQGPGELFYPSMMFIDSDTLKVLSLPSRKISKYDLDGNFYSDRLIEPLQLQNTKISPDGKRIASFVAKQIQKEGQQPDIDFSLAVIDKDSIKISSSLTSKIVSMQDLMAGKIDFNDLMIPFTAGNDYIYVSENSDAQYRIFAYDYSGAKRYEVRKSFKRIRYEKEEKEAYTEELKKMARGLQNINVGNFKKAITNIHTDKYGRLLVIPNVDRNEDKDGVYIDIFKDGKFLNRVNYPVQDKANSGILGMFKSMEFFVKDRLYVINMDELTLDVYDY